MGREAGSVVLLRPKHTGRLLKNVLASARFADIAYATRKPGTPRPMSLRDAVERMAFRPAGSATWTTFAPRTLAAILSGSRTRISYETWLGLRLLARSLGKRTEKMSVHRPSDADLNVPITIETRRQSASSVRQLVSVHRSRALAYRRLVAAHRLRENALEWCIAALESLDADVRLPSARGREQRRRKPIRSESTGGQRT